MKILNRRRRPPVRPPEPMHPRVAAVELLRDKIAADQAGLDPYDETIFVLQARDTERVWARRALELCGLVVDQTMDGRFRAVLEADVRAELGLDTTGRSLMLDEPLASRGAAYAVMDATIAALEQPTSLTALRDAKAAYDRRAERRST